MCSQENDTVRAKTFTHFGRNITFEKTCGQVLDTTFDELCDRALGASDYLQLAQYFHTIIIRDVPQLNLKLKSQTRRFITLIDSLYDHRIRVSCARLIYFLKLTDDVIRQVVLHSDVPLNYLFSNEKPSDLYISDEHRKLMDDLSMNKDSVICFKEIFYEI